MALSKARKDYLTGGSGVAPGSAVPDLLKVQNERLCAPCTIAVGAESSNNIDVTIQVVDLQGNNVSGVRMVNWWLSGTAGGTLVATAPTGGIAVQGTGTALNEYVTDKLGVSLSSSTGALVLRLTDTGTPTFFLNVTVDGMGGQFVSSAAITFA